jgi:signal transduction histidine kinase/ActR/RegA family two-component response regulator
MTMAAPDSYEQRVLVLAPTGRDAALIEESLARAGVHAELCGHLDEFARKVEQGAAAGLVAEEALGSRNVPTLMGALHEQPAWSDIPIVLMTSRQGPGDALSGLWSDGFNITLLERPVRMQTLISAVQSALRQRRRQYELRNYLSEQQQTEERLRRTQKLESLGVLAGGVAHDFNNLLTGIIGNASLALETVGSDSPAREFLEDALEASQRAADLTRQLLAYSGKGRFVIEPIDLSELVRQINVLLHTSISKNVQVKLELPAGLPCIIGDSGQIQQVIMNLVINAAEAIGPERSGAVHVRTGVENVDADGLSGSVVADNAVPGEYVYLEVRDTGCGITQSRLARIFDPFFTTKFTGRGLGLAAVQGIVRSHRGVLKVESTPGDGSTFRVLFPATEAAPGVKEETSEETLTGSGTILVVDDEAIVRKIARNALESYGYAAVLAENGQVALELFDKMTERPSAVLLDMTMPVMSGEETLRCLQAIQPDVKVILTSGYSEADATRRFTGAGLAGFLQKPYTAEQLARTIKAVCEARAERAG